MRFAAIFAFVAVASALRLSQEDGEKPSGKKGGKGGKGGSELTDEEKAAKKAAWEALTDEEKAALKAEGKGPKRKGGKTSEESSA